MNYLSKQDDTICAVITPPGVGAVNVIRVSGSQTISLIRGLFDKLPSEIVSHKAYFSGVFDGSLKVDDVLVTFFLGNKSFTGEESAEISCHGNPRITNQILQLLVGRQIRIAEKGEFSFRAFLNGKIDLVQAEGIFSLINSKSKDALKLSLSQLEGKLSSVIARIEDDIINLLAHIDASIDFSTEGLETFSYDQILNKVEALILEVSVILKSYKEGKVINNGVDVVLVGLPNVGKSSLYNLLLNDDKAIVTDIAGTTRDVLQSEIYIKGINVNLFDTAGIRDSDNLVEQLGIQKSIGKIKEATIVLFVKDVNSKLSKEEISLLNSIEKEKLVFIVNKIDLSPDVNSYLKYLNDLGVSNNYIIPISSHDKMYRQIILDHLAKFINFDNDNDSAILSQARHFERLSICLTSLEEAKNLTNQQVSVEFLSIELRTALIAVQEILGKHYDDQVLDKIFSQFCLGK